MQKLNIFWTQNKFSYQGGHIFFLCLIRLSSSWRQNRLLLCNARRELWRNYALLRRPLQLESTFARFWRRKKVLNFYINKIFCKLMLETSWWVPSIKQKLKLWEVWNPQKVTSSLKMIEIKALVKNSNWCLYCSFLRFPDTKDQYFKTFLCVISRKSKLLIKTQVVLVCKRVQYWKCQNNNTRNG
jgi:hypothetical protein